MERRRGFKEIWQSLQEGGRKLTHYLLGFSRLYLSPSPHLDSHWSSLHPSFDLGFLEVPRESCGKAFFRKSYLEGLESYKWVYEVLVTLKMFCGAWSGS